jgi:hypothetical protein
MRIIKVNPWKEAVLEKVIMAELVQELLSCYST